MALDIQAGDTLVTGGIEYRVRSALAVHSRPRSTPVISFATELAYTKRIQAIVNGQAGQVGATTIHLNDLRCTPPRARQDEFSNQQATDAPMRLWTTLVTDRTNVLRLVLQETA